MRDEHPIGSWRRTLAGVGIAVLTAAGCVSTAPPVADRAPVAGEPLYAAMIDAGSSGSRIYLYRWQPGGSEGELPWIEPAPHPRPAGSSAWEHKSEPGISSFAERPEGVREVLEPLIEFAIEKIGGDPAAFARFPLYLKATAGVRLLDEADQRRVLDAARAYLETTPFEVAGVDVISGREEGLYGWISVNYALGYLQRGGPFPTVGALDLGGASTQITFVPLDLPRAHGTALRFGDTVYRIYSHSYLGLGQDVGIESFASADCYPRGYPIPAGGVGAGDYDACRAAIGRAIAGDCAEPPCGARGVYQPPLYGDFLAFSAYTYALDFFGVGPTLALDRLEAAGRAYCAREWEEIEAEHAGGRPDRYLPQRCFSAAFIVTLLHEGYGFEMDSRAITVAPAIQGNELGWAQGALVYELGSTAAD